MLRSILVIGLILAVMVLVPQSAKLKAVPRQFNQTGITEPSAVSLTSEAEDVREEFTQNYPLADNGRLVLENLNGGVKISGWDRNEVQVQAVKRAFNRERLAEANIDVTSTPEVIRIRTRYPKGNQIFRGDEKGRYNNPATVDYTLTIPRKARLESVELINGSLEIDGVEGDVRASAVNGKVRARGLTGEIRLTTVNGPLEATFTKLENKSISLSCVNGQLTLLIPSNSNAVLRAGTVHGSITNTFGLEVEHGTYVGHSLYGQLGTGGPLIKLGNVNGSIHIKNIQDGAQLSTATSLLAVKDKDKSKDKDDETVEALENIQEASREIAAETRAAARAQARIQRQVQLQTRREVDRELQEAQREIQRAQRQVQLEVRRQLREQLRNEGVGAGTGAGVGKGVGGWRASDKETKSFPVTGTPRVHIATFDGTITVHGWDKSEVSYEATRRAATEAELKNIVIKSEQQGGAVSIIAENVDGNGTTDIDVYVPRDVSLNVSSGDGRLRLDGVSGDMTLRTGDGPVEVSQARGSLKLNTGDGPIKVTKFEGQIEARTGDGPILLDGNFRSLVARTGSGTVTLSLPGGSNFTLETNAEDVTSQGLAISEEVGPSRRLRRWKVGEGGNVFTVSTGEGKVILRAGQ
ncbi:MAG TPA: DUF4097 family beta strand repeat-containing protein [Pyrinomonadaceae bacterium]|nr:DUF4097 family beta strand repeat-containing protein [Pyrinomonadaceae bacterium]